MRSITTVRDQCNKDLQAAMPRGVDFLLHAILDQMFEHYFPSLDAIEDKIQMVQVEVFEDPSRETLDRIFALKKDVMQLRRICLPQREIINRLARADFKVISARAAVYFRDIYDNLYRIVEGSMSYQDMTQSTMDAYLSAVSNRLNETMKRLTIDQRAADAPDRDHRHLRHELRLHARAAVEVRLLLRARADGAHLRACSSLWMKRKNWL